MTKQPKEMTLFKLEVLVMPNGEILCLGKTIGYFKEFEKMLREPGSAVTGLPVEE